MELSDVDSPPTSPDVAGPSAGRKRQRTPARHKRAVAKEKRNKGEPYTSPASHRAMPQRVIGAACRDGCFSKVTMPGVQAIFSAFWAIGDYNLQNAYIQKMVAIMPIARKRTAAEVSRRSISRAYQVTYNNVTTKVCFSGFMAMHGISKRRIDNALRKMTHTSVPVPDQRGRHTPANKIVGERAEHVREHIRLLPAMTSHYSRAKAPNRLYLDSTLTIRKLYDMYLSWMAQTYPQESRVTFHYYSDVFRKDFNISFAPPKVDTCTTCDTINMTITNATTDGEKLAQQAKLDEHLKEARAAQDFVKRLKNDNDENTRAVCMDLQQILPTPKLHTGIAYYKRKMWTYNFCIHNIKTGESTMFVWYETVAKRGSIEVASCLKKWLDMEKEKGEFTSLVVVSDNCAGQNKNINLVLMYLRELHSRRLFDIDHVYLVSGHSFMACDRSFGNIERKVTNMGVIYTPDDYIDVIKTATSAGFPVVKMTQENFLDYSSLLQHVTKRRPPGTTFRDCRKLLFRLAYPQGYLVKSDYEPDDNNIIKVRLQKGRAAWSHQLFDLSTQPLPQKYTSPIALRPEKVRDLQSLLALMPQNAHPFYRSIIDAQAGDVNSTQDDGEHDNLDELLEYES